MKNNKSTTTFERVVKGKKSYNKLMKDTNNASWSGVLSGIGKHTGLNVTFLRTAVIVAGLMTGFTALFIYFIVSWFIMNEYNADYDQNVINKRTKREKAVKDSVSIKKEKKITVIEL